MRFTTKDSAVALLKANHITMITSVFKMDLINDEINTPCLIDVSFLNLVLQTIL